MYCGFEGGDLLVPHDGFSVGSDLGLEVDYLLHLAELSPMHAEEALQQNLEIHVQSLRVL